MRVQREHARGEREPAKAVYKQRTGTPDCINAGCRNRGLLRFLIRRHKKKAVGLWYALAHNMVCTGRYSPPEMV